MDEKIRFDYNPDSEKLKKALKFVQQYIIKTNAILVGGMALDSALQLKGSKIYDPKVTIPDYDFMHYDSVNISYDLVKILQKMFPDSNVDVVRAVHTTTMRVRVNWVVVADMTYLPKEIFDKINTLEFRGMRIIHPGYTMMDQLDALSRPYINPPREVINHRWEKDWKRMKLISKYYGVSGKDNKTETYSNDHPYIFCKDYKKFISSIQSFEKEEINPIITGVSGLSFLFTDKKHKSHIPISYNKEKDELQATTKDFARLSIMIGNASVKWWKNMKMHNFTKDAKKITWYNESLNYPHRVEVEYKDFTLELIYMNYNCLTYVSSSIHPLVGCLWSIISRALVYHNEEYSNLATHVIKTYLFESDATSIPMSSKISIDVIDTGVMINPSLRLSLEYHHVKSENKRLKNKKTIYVPGSWNPEDKDSKIPKKFEYSKSYYYTVLNAKPITSIEFNDSIESLEVLSRYLEIKN